MRVALVSEHASPLAVLGGADAGGQNVHVAELAGALAARGHEVTVFTRRTDPDLDDTVALRDGVVVEHLTAGPACELPKDELLPHVPELGEQLAKHLAADEPDVVHAHFWMSGLAALAAAPAGVPVVQTFHALGRVKRRHQGAADTSPPQRLVLEQEVAAGVDRVVASCADEVAELRALGVGPGRVDVVPSGVDVDAFTPDGPVAARTDRPRLLAVGRLVRRKGLDDALEVLARVPAAELVVAGGPPADALTADAEARRLLARAEALGVADRLCLAGSVPRTGLPALLRSADVVLCLPWYEPFGIVPLEAMGCGVPVVASAVGGMLDTVVDGVTGRHVAPRRPDDAARAVADLLDRPGARAAMGRAARERAVEYAWPRVAERTEAVYLAATDGTPR